MINAISTALTFNTRRVVISTADNGLLQLHTVLKRINVCKDNGSNNAAMAKLRNMFADQLHLAYADWKAFCHKWQVTVYCDKSIEESSKFRLKVMNRDNMHDIKFDFVL